MDPLISLLVFILVVGAIGYLCYWAVGALIPDPPGRVIKVIVAVLFAVLILVKVLRTFEVSLSL